MLGLRVENATEKAKKSLIEFIKKSSRPPVELKVYRCGTNLWTLFRSYHYLNGKLGAGIRCYTATYQNKPVAFIAVACTKMKTKYFRVSRLVVLSDYQGIGVGKRLLTFIAELYSSQTNLLFYIITSNPQLVHGNMSKWTIARFVHASRGKGNTRINNELSPSLSRGRLTVTLQYRH